MRRALLTALALTLTLAACDTHTAVEPDIDATPTPLSAAEADRIATMERGLTSLPGGQTMIEAPQRSGKLPGDPVSPGLLALDRGLLADTVEFAAFVSVLKQRGTPEQHYEYRQIPLTFPEAIVAAAGGRTKAFGYTLSTPDGLVLRRMEAVIPDDVRALRRMEAWARHRPDRARTWSGDDVGCFDIVTPQECSGDGSQVDPNPESGTCYCYAPAYGWMLCEIVVCEDAEPGDDDTWPPADDDWPPTCTDCDGDDPRDGGPDDDGDDSGGGGGAADVDPNPSRARASKYELANFFESCGFTNTQTQDKAFEANVRNNLGFNYTTKRAGSRQLDGITEGHYTTDGHVTWVINSILEAKFSEQSPPFRKSQSADGIELLREQYDLIPTNTNIGVPSYVMVSMYKGDLRHTDYNDELAEFSNDRGIDLYHYTATKSNNNYYIEGGLVGQNILGMFNGKIVSHSLWGSNNRFNFDLECITR